jgi:hypothetical protein
MRLGGAHGGGAVVGAVVEAQAVVVADGGRDGGENVRVDRRAAAGTVTVAAWSMLTR